MEPQQQTEDLKKSNEQVPELLRNDTLRILTEETTEKNRSILGELDPESAAVL